MVHGSGSQRRIGNPYLNVRRRRRKKQIPASKLHQNGLRREEGILSEEFQSSCGCATILEVKMEKRKEEEKRCKRRRRLFSAFIGTLATLGVVVGCIMVLNEPEEEIASIEKRYDVKREHRYRSLGTPLKVLVLTDDEESATLMADVFDQDRKAFYLYEPLWGFYQTMGYGASALRYPWDINVNYDGSLRKPPSHEISLEKEVMKAIMECNTDSISVEMLLNKFIFQKDNYSLRTVRHLSLEDFGYLECIIKQFKGQEEVLGQVQNCKTPIENFCPNFHYDGSQINCYKIINMYKGAHQVSKQVLDRIAQKPENYLGFFMDHQLCLNDLKPKVAPCTKNFKQACQTADLIAVVTMRMNLDAIHEVAKAIPNLKVLHITRDPRDTLAFARANHFSERTMDVSREAGRLCNKVWSDIQNLSALKQINDTMMQLKYEDIVGDPRQSMEKLRVFMGMQTASRMPSLITSLFAASESQYSRTIERHQDSRNIGVWQRMFSQYEIELMNQVCSSSIQAMGY